MAKKKGAIAAKARAKREQQRGTADGPSTATAAAGPIVHADGKRVHRGLMNLGNTCYINSVVQCLNVSVPFSDDLIQLAGDGLDGMSGALCTVMRGIRATDDTEACLQKFSPKAFQTELVNQFPWYSGKQQQDAHEFLRTLLGAVADERTITERARIEEFADGGGDGTIPDLDAPGAPGLCVAQNFKGNLLSVSLCWTCGNVNERLDPFLDLSLDLPMPSGTSRKPLGITPNLELCLPDACEEEVPEVTPSVDAAETQEGPLMGRWAAKRDAEIIAELRLSTPMLVERIILNALIRLGVPLKAEPEGPSVEITLSRQSKQALPRWGFRWNEAKLQGRAYVVGGIKEDTLLDKWNLKRMSTGSSNRAVFPGDHLVEVNGEKEYEGMRRLLKYENELNLRFVRSTAKQASDVCLHDETDDEAEELRAAIAAALEVSRRDFCEQATNCFQALPHALQDIFGAARTSRIANGNLELHHCLEQFSMADALEDDYKPVYSCAVCKSTLGQRTFASRRLWLWPAGLPPILTIQLKRFRRYAADFVKSVTSVAVPAELDLSNHALSQQQLESLAAHAAAGSDLKRLAEEMKATGPSALRYELYGLCEHQGSEMQDGHYVAYINSGPSLAREEWYGISDAKKWKCERADVLKVEAYVAFYRRAVPSQHAASDPSTATLDAS